MSFSAADYAGHETAAPTIDTHTAAAANAETPSLPVTTKLVLWLRADAGVTTVPESSEVTCWADQRVGDNRKANDASCPSAEARPRRVDCDRFLAGHDLAHHDQRRIAPADLDDHADVGVEPCEGAGERT